MEMEEWQDTQEQTDDIEEYEPIDETDLSHEYATGIRDMELQGLMDIGNLASWTANSSKQGYGLDQLRNESPLTYWQSDGPQPHHIDIQFSKRVSIERISIFCDNRFDESYTPKNLVVLAGTGKHDLQEVTLVELHDPNGWSHILLNDQRKDQVLKTYLLRITVTANHQNGKDTHIRAIKLYSPAKPSSQIQFNDTELEFTSVEMLSETVVR